MKTLIKTLSLCVLGSALGLQAADFPRYYFKVDAGGNLPMDVEIKNTVPRTKISFDPGARVDLGAGYRFNEALSTEIQIGGIWNSVDKVGGVKVDDVDFWQVPLMANLIYTFPVQSRLKPFVGIGAGGIYSRFEFKDEDSEDDFSFAYQALAGITYALSDRMDIGLTYKFLGTLEQEFGDVKLENIYNHSLMATFIWRF